MSEVIVEAVSQAETVKDVTIIPESINAIALVIDGIVQDVIHCDDRLAAIMLSSPTIIEVNSHKENINVLGWLYDSEANTLTPPPPPPPAPESEIEEPAV